MLKAKVSVGLAVVVGALLVAAVPAGAWFRSDNEKTSGEAKLPETTTLEAGGGVVTCTREAESKVEWIVQKKEPQEPVKEGPHELLVIVWGKLCRAKAPKGSEFAATVSSCKLDVLQANKFEKEGAALGSVLSECVIKTAGGLCELKVPTAGNAELKEVFLKKAGEQEVAIEPKVSGITVNASSLCKAEGIESSKTGTYKTKEALVTKGQQLV